SRDFRSFQMSGLARPSKARSILSASISCAKCRPVFVSYLSSLYWVPSPRRISKIFTGQSWVARAARVRGPWRRNGWSSCTQPASASTSFSSSSNGAGSGRSARVDCSSNGPGITTRRRHSCHNAPHTVCVSERRMDAKLEDLSFTYFPENYRWSHGLLIGLNMAPWGGAEIGEVNRVGLRLKKCVGDDDAWFREWAREARKVEDAGRQRIAEGYTTSGAQYLQRASAYYHVGERFLQPKSKEGLDAYMRGVTCFRDAAKYIRRPRMEHVEIPYDGKSLPAVYVHAEPASRSGKVPAMVFFDGLDVTKEIQYFKGVADLAARGIACLIVDGPGNGESIRFRGLYLRPDTEHYATPAFDYLAARPEVDA